MLIKLHQKQEADLQRNMNITKHKIKYVTKHPLLLAFTTHGKNHSNGKQ